MNIVDISLKVEKMLPSRGAGGKLRILIGDCDDDTGFNYVCRAEEHEKDDRICGRGDTVSDCIESFFSNLYNQFYLVPECRQPDHLRDLNMEFVYDAVCCWENESEAEAYIKAVNLMVDRQHTQHDKAGLSYYFHPMQVSMGCETMEQKTAAVLHDVLEDTDVTPDMLLQMGITQRIVEGVIAVTRQEGESYADFVLRASKNSIGKAVKKADLLANLDILRLPAITEKDCRRLDKYLHAYRFLIGLEKDTSQIHD